MALGRHPMQLEHAHRPKSIWVKTDGVTSIYMVMHMESLPVPKHRTRQGRKVMSAGNLPIRALFY